MSNPPPPPVAPRTPLLLIDIECWGKQGGSKASRNAATAGLSAMATSLLGKPLDKSQQVRLPLCLGNLLPPQFVVSTAAAQQWPSATSLAIGRSSRGTTTVLHLLLSRGQSRFTAAIPTSKPSTAAFSMVHAAYTICHMHTANCVCVTL